MEDRVSRTNSCGIPNEIVNNKALKLEDLQVSNPHKQLEQLADMVLEELGDLVEGRQNALFQRKNLKK